MNTQTTWIQVIRRPSERDFRTEIRRGALIAGKAGYEWVVLDRDGRVRRTGWTAGTRDDAQTEARRDVLDLCTRLAFADEPVFEEEEPTLEMERTL